MTQIAIPPASPPVQRYVQGGHRGVAGWLSRLDAGLIAAVGRFQHASGLGGPVGEIGVHHGRLFILLALLTRADERAVAIDLFDDQQFNIDRSGEGDEAVFRRNMARFGVAADRVRVVKGNSMELTCGDLAAQAGAPLRLFSIDGGHTAEITLNDLRIADDGLGEGGVIVLDDYFNPEFPAVSEGMCRFVFERPQALVPFAIGDNKLLLCRRDWADRYRDALVAATPPGNHVRATVLFGQEVAVFRTPSTLMQRIRQSAITRRLRAHPLGRALKPLVRRFVQG